MAAQFTVGQQLPNGATVTSDTFVTGPDGTTVETMVDSANNRTAVTVPGPNTPVANAQTVQTRVQANLATIESFIAANPGGAVLTAAQTLVLARMLAGLCRILLGEFNTVGGS